MNNRFKAEIENNVRNTEARPADSKEQVKAFQNATRKVMRRMARDERFGHVMYGTDVYSSLLAAYAASLGKTLSDDNRTPSLVPVETIWNELHDL